MTTDSFQYVVRDDFTTAPGLVNVEILGAVNFVSASDDSAQIITGNPVTISPLLNDQASTALLPLIVASGSVTSPTPSGTALIAANQRDIIYTPGSGFVGTAAFDYDAQSSVNAAFRSTGTVSVLVLPQPPAGGLVVPEDFDTISASYTGATYYVSGNGAGALSRDRAAPGNLRATMEAAPDRSTIILRGGLGDYAGFQTIRPLQTGRLKLIAENPTHRGMNPDSFDPIIGANNTDLATIAGLIDVRFYRNLWVEGLYFKDSTQGAMWISDTSDGTSWFVRCKGLNNRIRQMATFRNNSVVFWETWTRCDKYGGAFANWWSDYQIQLNETERGYFVRCFFHGGGNQVLALKDRQDEVYIQDCVFDQTIVVGGTSGGTVILVGQSVDTPSLDQTSRYCRIVRCRFRKSAGNVIVGLSNIQDCDLEDCDFFPGSGTAARLLDADARDDKNVSGDTVRRPRHPRLWRVRNNRIHGAQGNYRWNRGKTYINAATSPTGPTRLIFENNATPSGGIIGTAVADGGFSAQGQPDFDGNAQIVVTYGPNAGFNPP